MTLKNCQHYEYASIFTMLGTAIRELLISQEGPYPIFESWNEYAIAKNNSETSFDFGGISVWNTQKYYAGSIEYFGDTGVFEGSADITTPGADYITRDVGFFVVPEFGNVSIIPNMEFRQIVTVAFDTNSEPDYDPYGMKIIQYIDWFLNAYTEKITNAEIHLPNTGQKLYNFIGGISRPTFNSALSVYVRRSVTITIRYCRAGG